MTHALPLISGRSASDLLAWRPDGPVTVGQYLGDVQALAGWLPSGRWVINLCEDRYRFAVLLGACAVTKRVSLQPSSQSLETLQQLAQAHEGAFVLSDADAGAEVPGLPVHRWPVLSDLPREAWTDDHVPAIPADQVVAILFTSGSTGRPQPHAKSWGRLVANGRAEAEALGIADQPHVLVGTVPVQHSYGFESTFLLALHGGCTFWFGKPFYPQDLAEALAAVPRPRLVVTTPYHLSSFMAADVPLPPVDRWLSATAPLSEELARRVEDVTGAPVHEIYGSTESSQLATRRTTQGPVWTLMPGVRLEQEGDTTYAVDGHVERRVALSDVIGLQAEPGRFVLHGRHADMVNLAGKRTSLAYLNHQLCEIDGVRDGAFFLPREDSESRVARLVAFAVVEHGCSRADLMAALRRRIDPIFLPRPLVLVPALPRNQTGKILRETLEQLYAAHVAGRGGQDGR